MDQEDLDSKICQALHDHGILDINDNPHHGPSEHRKEIPVELVWLLYKKVNRELGESKAAQDKQVTEHQSYVEKVRQLSKERDQLTSEFEAENDTLRRQLEGFKLRDVEEEKHINNLFHKAMMPEYVSKSRAEQVELLMETRLRLLEKLAVTEKVKTKHSDLEKQLHELRSEDSDLRNKMELAMSEMGGMADSLTRAMQERDRLKREVTELNKTLSQVRGLPTQNVNDMAAKTQIMALENSVNYYAGQIERLTTELDKSKTQGRIREAELLAELKEYKEMNGAKGAAENAPPQAIVMSERYLSPETQQQLQAKSKMLITEMEAALQTDRKLAEEREKNQQEEITELKNRIQELEATGLYVRDDSKTLKVTNAEFQELKAQLAEMDRQCKVAKAEEAEAKEKFHKLQREVAKTEAQYKQSERQLNTQSEISYGLKQRNDELELELAKIVGELRSSNDKQNNLVSDRRRFENEMNQNQEEMKELREYISEMKRKHDKEIRDLKSSRDDSSKLKSYVASESKRVSELQVQLTNAHTRLEVEKGKRFTAEEELETAKLDFECAIKKKEELSRELDDLYMKNESLEHQLEMMSGQYEDRQTQKLVEDMSRQQLEDVTNVMRVKLMSSLDRSHNYCEKYNSLKRKHKDKLRKIRELMLIERQTTADEVEKLELRVMLAESALERELAWKQNALEEVRKTEEEHRKAVDREDEARMTAEKSILELHEALNKYQNLSDENKMLNSQLEHLEFQKMEIERLVSRESQKSELNTLLNELNLSGSLPKSVKEPSAATLEGSGFDGAQTAEYMTGSLPAGVKII